MFQSRPFPSRSFPNYCLWITKQRARYKAYIQNDVTLNLPAKFLKKKKIYPHPSFVFWQSVNYKGWFTPIHFVWTYSGSRGKAPLIRDHSITWKQSRVNITWNNTRNPVDWHDRKFVKHLTTVNFDNSVAIFINQVLLRTRPIFIFTFSSIINFSVTKNAQIIRRP